MQRLGGTVVVMAHFDAEAYLRLVAQHRVSHSQLVPTMFVRLLKLPAGPRSRHDLSSLRCAIHAAAPCPVAIKQQMIDWWGPVLWEYYAGTEGNGITMINSAEWLGHQGSVGKAVIGELRIVDDDSAQLLPTGRPARSTLPTAGPSPTTRTPPRPPAAPTRWAGLPWATWVT